MSIFVHYLFLTLSVFLPCAASVEGYWLTEQYFKRKMIPFPFEHFGVAVGLGCFFWALGLVILIWTLCKRRGSA